jgi:DNA-binding NarL/FixJ family response regulator
MDDLSKLLNVIGLFYESVIDEEKWPQALQSLSDCVGGTGAFHVIANPQTGVITHSESVGVDPVVNQQYLQYYAAKEVRLAPALPNPVGVVMTENGLIERRALEGSEIYGELLAPNDIPHIMQAWLQKKADAFQTVVIEGSARHGAFQTIAMEQFSLIMPHLVRAARMRELLVSALQSHLAYAQVLETLPFGVIFLDDNGQVIQATLPAEQLLRDADGLVQTRSRVRATHVDDNRRLQQVIQNTVTARVNREASGDTVVVRRVNSLRPLVVTTIPVLSPELLINTPQAAGLMLIVDPERTPQPRLALIQKALHLTKAEAVLANALVTGVPLREAAETLGRSINTCKTQLKSIYAKTGCCSHVDLAKKLMMASIGQLSC